MKKRLALLCLIPALLANLFGCKKAAIPEASVSAPYSKEEPLMASVESQAAAEELAQQYEITLVTYSNGLATFYTQEDPAEVIRRGQENGWPQLSLNTIQKAM